MNRDSISNMRLTSLYFSGGGIYVKIILACLKNNRIDVEEACQSSLNSAHVRPVRESQTR